MKVRLGLVLILLSGSLFISGVLAQDQTASPAEAAAELRGRLIEVQAREAELTVRLNQLDEDLRPENIERALAGIGSTRPEELRQLRHRQLTLEKDGVRKQLDLLNTSRVRLESAIQSADNRAYQQSAQGYTGNQLGSMQLSSVNPRRSVITAVMFLGLLGILGVVALIRRL